MKLGETLWKIPFSDSEKQRLASELNKDTGLVHSVFVDNHRNSQMFDSICRKMTRDITGFRPNSEPYRRRVSTEVLKALKQNKSRQDFWRLYQGSVVDHVVSNLSALNQLLADTEVPDDFDCTSDGILAAISEHARDYSVHDRDLEVLYEIWPFGRTDRIREYVANCPKFDRFRAIEETARSIESRLEKYANETRTLNAEATSHLSLEFKEKGATKKDLKAAIEGFATTQTAHYKTLDGSIQQLTDQQTRLEKLFRRSESRRSSERKEFAVETEKHLDLLTKGIANLKKGHKEFEGKLETYPERRQSPQLLEVPQAATRNSPFSVLRENNGYKGMTEISVDTALRQFRDIAKADKLKSDTDILVYFYSSMLSSCILVDDKDEFDVWNLVVGWDRAQVTVCASPLWVDEECLTEHIAWLFEEPEEPRSITILDFDLGYPEGYLLPFLRAWRRSSINLPWKKMILTPSSPNWRASRGLGDEVSLLPAFTKDAHKLLRKISSESNLVSAKVVRSYLNDISFGSKKPTYPPAPESHDDPDKENRSINENVSAQIEILSRLPLDTEETSKFVSMANAYWERRGG